MTTKQITEHLLKELKQFGAIDWHKSKHSSRYIKFKDTRLGSIRIADHTGRSGYKYTYELTNLSTEEEIQNVVDAVVLKSKTIPNFDGTKYIVFSKWQGIYVEAPDFKAYKNHILKKELL